MAMDDDLVELLLGPDGTALSAEVVQHQKRHRIYLLEQFVVANWAVRAERGPEVVQQCRDEGEEHLAAFVEPPSGDGHRQMGLAAAPGPAQEQPALRLGGEGPGGVHHPIQGLLVLGRSAGAAQCVEILEGHPLQHLGANFADAQHQPAVEVAQLNHRGRSVGAF